MTDTTEVPSLPSMPDLLLQLAEDNPRMHMVARYLAAQAQSEAQATESEAEQADSADRQEIASTLRRLAGEVDELRRRNDALAAALGACYLCWGEDHTCPNCGGRGSPGSIRPHRQEFATYVLPAVRRMSHDRGVRRDQPTSETEGAGS